MISRRNKIILVLVLILASSFAGYQALSSTKVTKCDAPPVVYLITKSMDSNFFKSVFAGASAASAEYNIDLYHRGPDNEEYYAAQNEMIQEAINVHADAIIISAVDYEANAAAVNKAADEGIEIVVIDSDVKSNRVACRIGTDNYQAGCIAAKAAVNEANDEYNIGIINFDRITENGRSREQGFREAIEKCPNAQIAKSVNIPSTVSGAARATKNMLEENPKINVLVAFNEILSIGAGDAIEELGMQNSTKVIAFDSNVACIDHLEKGNIDALIVQNPYAMGYLAVETVESLLSDKEVEEEINTTVTLITKENMYTEECQKILFAFSQN